MGRDIILRLVNQAADPKRVNLTFPTLEVRQACTTSPAEVDLDSLPVTASRIFLDMPSRQLVSLRIIAS